MRKSPSSRKSALTRIHWTHEEKAAIVAKAAEIRASRTDLSGPSLVRAAMRVLPDNRRREIVAQNQVPWFEESLKKESARLADVAKKDAAKDAVKEVKRTEPLDILIAVNRGILEGVEECKKTLAAMLREMQTHNVRMAAIAEQWGVSGIEQLFPQFAPAANGNGNGNSHGRHNPIDPTVKAKPKTEHVPKIAIVGADLREQNAVSEKVGHKARLYFLKRESPNRKLPEADYLIITRHASHEWWNMGLKVYGRDRTYRIDTSGVDSIAAKVIELAQRPQSMS